MTTSGQPLPALRRAAVRATAAASFYNTQPWRMELTADRIRLLADRGRQLSAHDPSGRQLTISCGCALMNAQVSLAGEGYSWTVSRFPVGAAPGAPLAVLAVEPDRRSDQPPIDGLAGLAGAVEFRHTNQSPFLSDGLPGGIIDRLRAAATTEGADLHLLDNPDQRRAVLALQRDADRIAGADPAFQAERRAWARMAGISADGADPAGDGATRSTPDGTEPAASGVQPTLLLLSSPGDTPPDWLRAGEALQRVLLEVADQGCAVSLHSGATQVSSVRAELRALLAFDGHPQMLLQIGTAPPGSPTRRRRLMDVISEAVPEPS